MLARHQIIDTFYYGMHIKWLCALHYECENANKTFFLIDSLLTFSDQLLIIIIIIITIYELIVRNQ